MFPLWGKALAFQGVRVGQRIVKRVTLDFEWPLGETWHGYINPWPGPVPCFACGTSGFNPVTKRLFDQFCSWAPRLTLGEAQLLEEKGCTKTEIKRLKARIFTNEGPLIRPTLVEIRAKRKNAWGHCEKCSGEGFVANSNPAVQVLYVGVNLYEEWEPIEPPDGPGWQLWDDTNELGSPLSPVFMTADGLARWCLEKHKKGDLPKWVSWVNKYRDLPKEKPRAPFRIASDHFKVFTPLKPKFLD